LHAALSSSAASTPAPSRRSGGVGITAGAARGVSAGVSAGRTAAVRRVALRQVGEVVEAVVDLRAVNGYPVSGYPLSTP
jgi:hypothetical protein